MSFSCIRLIEVMSGGPGSNHRARAMILGRAGEERRSGETTAKRTAVLACVIFVTKGKAQVKGWNVTG